MPNRIIKESICTSDDMASLTWFEQALFIRLIVTADDYGRMDARPSILRGRLFPLDNVTVKDITAGLAKLSTAGMVNLYEVGGKPYVQLTAWSRHQTPRAKESKYPEPNKSSGDEPNEDLQADESKCEQMLADAPDIRYSNSIFDIRYSGESTRARRFTPPTFDEVAAYCLERQNNVDAQRFVDFYAAKGWRVGNQPMKDWKAAVRTWERRDEEGNNAGTSGNTKPAKRFNVHNDLEG